MPPDDQAQKAGTAASWTHFLVPVLVVATVAFAWLWLTGKGGPGDDRGSANGSIKAESVYYVFLSEVELYPTKSNGDAWDATGAPDIRYRLAWQGVTIHESETKEDSLIGEWSGLREGAIDKLLGEDKLNAGKLRAARDATLRIEVEDADTLTPDDPAGIVELEIMSLREGLNDLRFDEKTAENAIKRLQLRLVSKDQPMEDILGKMR